MTSNHELADFEAGLREQLESTPDLRRHGKKILNILNARLSKQRTRRIDLMERHARASVESDKAINWFTVDWSAIIKTILKVLLALLPFILLA